MAGKPANAPSVTSYTITWVAWAPSCGESYHLITNGGQDGHVRIWKVKTRSDDAMEGGHEAVKWTAVSVAPWLILIILSRLSPFFLLQSHQNLSLAPLLVEWNGTSVGMRSCVFFSYFFVDVWY